MVYSHCNLGLLEVYLTQDYVEGDHTSIARSHIVMEQFYVLSLVLTGLKGPMIRDAMPFPSKLLDCSSFLSASFFTGGIPCFERTRNNLITTV